MMAYGGEDIHLHLFLISALVPAYLLVEWGVWMVDYLDVVGKREGLTCESVMTHYTDRAFEALLDDQRRAWPRLL